MAIEIQYIGGGEPVERTPVHYRWDVKLGVRGAYRVTTETFDSLKGARKRAERWARSNSIGSYWAIIEEVAEHSSGHMVTYREEWNVRQGGELLEDRN
ncbi:MAG TPA: hypothetical protein VLA34_02450 [Candidatus Krumholzibacterium sp.]|nr:hypothetical protein [Candidatus Krumholzibacterium sp.]